MGVRGVCLLCVVLAGCGDAHLTVGDDAASDASTRDASHAPIDAARTDAATLVDAATIDSAAPLDAAAPMDAAPPLDAAVPTDAYAGGIDAICAVLPGITPIMLHTVEPDPTLGNTRDLAHVHVHAESACGSDLQLATDATGHLTIDLPNAGAPWAITVALAGHAAVSILDITRIAFDGDVRLDPIATTASMQHMATGMVTGVTAGDQVGVDTYDSGTGTDGSFGSFFFYSRFHVGDEMPSPPLQFVALEFDSSPLPTLLNIGVSAPMPRPDADVVPLIPIAMSSPRQTPVVTHITLHLPTSGITGAAPVNVNGFPAQHARFDLPNAPTLVSGSVMTRQPAYPTPDYELTIAHFPGPFDVNRTGVWSSGSTSPAVIDVNITDITDHEITVPSVTALTTSGTSLDTLSAQASGDGYDLLVLYLGEGMYGPRPQWRVFATASGGEAHIDALPHLPSAVTLADIGLGAATTSFIPRYVRMHTGRGWSTEALWAQVCCGRYGGPWQHAWSVGTTYQTIATTGR